MTQAPHFQKTIVLLHGIGFSGRGFARQSASFAKAGYKVLTPDLPGHGGREAVLRMDFDDLAGEIEALLDAGKIEKPVLAGHSMGGMIAQVMLRRRPEAYAAAVLIGTSPAFGNPDGEAQKKFIADRLAPLDEGRTLSELAAGIVDDMMGPAPDSAGRALAIEFVGATPASSYRAAWLCLRSFDARADLARIRCPVLCMAGEHDRNAPPAVSEKMAAKIPNAAFVCLPGLGHVPHLEASELFDRTMLDFLRGI